MENNALFCPACGAQVNVDAGNTGSVGTEFGIMPEYGIGKGIGTTGNFENIRELVEQFRKVKKKFQTIATIVAIVYAYFMVRYLLRDLENVLAGNGEVTEFIEGVGAIILFTCGLVYLVVQFGLPWVAGTKVAFADEYLQCIYVNDKEALVATLKNMQCPAVKNLHG